MKHRPLFFALAAAATLALPGLAQAHGGCPCGAVRGVVNAAKTDVNNHTTGEIFNLRSELVTAIVQTGKFISGTVESAQKAQMKVDEQMTEQDHLAERDIEKRKKSQDVLPAAHRACQSATAGASSGTLEATAGQYRQSIEASNLWHNINYTPETSGMATATASSLVNSRRQEYCDPVSAQRGICELKSGISEAEQRERAQADIRAESLFRDPTLEQENSLQWARDYARNATRPVPPAPLPVGSMDSPRGKLAQMERAKYDARISAAQQVFEWQIAQRAEPSQEMKAWTENLMTGRGAGAVLMGDRSGMEDKDPGKISVLEMIELEVMRRYANESWYAEVNAAKDENQVLKEIAFMDALSLFMTYKRFELEQRVAAVEAAGMSAAAEAAYNTGSNVGTPMMGISTGNQRASAGEP